MTSRKQRWITALHEAGHLVVAVRLNRWRCSASAYVLENGAGVTNYPAGLTRFDARTATAAARWAEKLERLYPAPARRRRPPMPEPGFTAERIRAEAVVEAQAQAAASSFAQATTDEVSIAAWCISGCEGEPREWLRRYRRIQAAGRLAVWRWQGEIVKVAKRLFHVGAVHIAGDEQDEDALRQRAQNQKGGRP